MEKDQAGQKINLEEEVAEGDFKCSDGDPDYEGTGSGEFSALNKNRKEKMDSTERDFEWNRTSNFEDIEPGNSYLNEDMKDLSDDDDDMEVDIDEEDKKKDYDGGTDSVEKEPNLEFLSTEDDLIDSFFVEDTPKEDHGEVENVAVEAEREPVIFGILSEFLPVCVVTLDFACDGNSCYELRELLKKRLWSQSSEILDQFIVIYNLYHSSDSCLKRIVCDEAIQFHVQISAINVIETLVNKFQSEDFSGILELMLLSHDIREKMKNLNAQFSVTCQCENIDYWKTEFERTSLSFEASSAGRNVCLTWNYTSWPGASTSFNPRYSEEKKVPMVTMHHRTISEDSRSAESTSFGSSFTDLDETEREWTEDASLFTTDNNTLVSSPSPNEISAQKPSISRSSSVDHLSSEGAPLSSSSSSERETRRRSF